MPGRYGFAKGEIVGPFDSVSKQSDIVIYDRIDGCSFLSTGDIQIFPFEAIFGIIDVKSSLSKTELIKSLENIKSVKALVPNEAYLIEENGFISKHNRQKPFGIVFVYELSDNSLESLRQNITEWEKENNYGYWPNLIVILNHGIIYHHGGTIRSDTLLSNEEIKQAKGLIYLQYEKDTLFHFFTMLLQLCSSTKLGPLTLNRYFDPGEIIGSHSVKHHNRFVNIINKTISRLNISFIEKVVNYCKSVGPITQREMLMSELGVIPEGFDDDSLNELVYL